MPIPSHQSSSKQQLYAALGLFFITLSIYFLLSPGRIDTTDSQVRYDATLGVLETGLPLIANPYLEHTTGVSRSSIAGSPLVSSYAPSSQLIYAPFLKTIKLFSQGNREIEQFWFSQINRIFSALIIVVLFYFYLQLGHSLADAIKWSLLLAFCTEFFINATSSFHQIPQAFFLLCSVFAAFLSSRKNSLFYCLLSAIAFGIFLGFKVGYILLLPGVLLILVHSRLTHISELRGSIKFWGLFLLVALLFIEFWQFYYGLYHNMQKAHAVVLPSLLPADAPDKLFQSIEKTLSGLMVVLISPGKGLLFFSPLLFIGLFKWKFLITRHKGLAAGIGLIILSWLFAMGKNNSPAGDWCWGNRYAMVTAPLVFLFLPEIFRKIFAGRAALGKGIIILSFCIQLLGLSLDYYRFFLNHSLPENFFLSRMFYFQTSQLIERPFEILDSVNKMEKVNFNPPFRPGPFPESATYAIYGMSHPDPVINQQFMLEFPLLWLPNPWPLWVPFLEMDKKPVNVLVAAPAGILILIGGLVLIRRAKSGKAQDQNLEG